MARNDRERRVALAIGRSIWGTDVEPRGGWLKAARAALEASGDDDDCIDPSVSYSTGTITATLPAPAETDGKKKRRKKLTRRPIGFMADIDTPIPVED